MINPLSVVSDGYLECGSPLTIVARGYLDNCEETPDKPDPIPTPGNGGGGGFSYSGLRKKFKDEALDSIIKKEDDEIVVIIKAFVRCQ